MLRKVLPRLPPHRLPAEARWQLSAESDLRTICHCSIMHMFHYPFLVNGIHTHWAPNNIHFRLDSIVEANAVEKGKFIKIIRRALQGGMFAWKLRQFPGSWRRDFARKTAQWWRIDHFEIIDVIESDLTSIRFIKIHVSTELGPWERGWERKISDSLLDEPEEKFVKCVRGMLWLCVSDGNRNSSGNKIVVQDEKGLIAEN